MKISEIFYSIQGEGKLAGLPSAFIRTSGCNLRCTWCDSPYTSWQPEGDALSHDQILERLSGFPTKNVVFTGGEPLIAVGVEELTRRIKHAGYHLTIETAATVWKDVVCDLASLSPKLANSTPWERDAGRRAEAHERQRVNLDVIRRFMTMPDYQLKFVVDDPHDLVEIDALLASIADPALSGPPAKVQPANVLLMPQGVTRDELDARGVWIADLCKQRGFRFCPRLHIALFGHVRGT